MRWHLGCGRAYASEFNFVGLQWYNLVGGLVLYVGVGRVLVLYASAWRKTDAELASEAR